MIGLMRGCLGLALVLCVLGAQAQPFPSKPVRLISAYPTGISPDVATRLVAERLSKAWSQPVIVEPRPGGNGAGRTSPTSATRAS